MSEHVTSALERDKQQGERARAAGSWRGWPARTSTTTFASDRPSRCFFAVRSPVASAWVVPAGHRRAKHKGNEEWHVCVHAHDERLRPGLMTSCMTQATHADATGTLQAKMRCNTCTAGHLRAGAQSAPVLWRGVQRSCARCAAGIPAHRCHSETPDRSQSQHHQHHQHHQHSHGAEEDLHGVRTGQIPHRE